MYVGGGGGGGGGRGRGPRGARARARRGGPGAGGARRRRPQAEGRRQDLSACAGIATLPQPNPRVPSWPDFWVEARLLPRWRRVRDAFSRGARGEWDRLVSRMGTILEGWKEDGLSLLHGDLWSGNVMTDREGRPVLIDPAVYRGHREVDLAMMELFGGFAGEALRAYGEASPLRPGYEERRRDAYQLYPLLVHVELFGGGYVGGAEARIRRLAAL
jgi:protein-ribulosamine 3-kinase